MQRARTLFALSALIALAWTACLIYLVKTAADPIVVSAPQIHFATFIIVGNVTLENGEAKVVVTKVVKDTVYLVRQQSVPKEIRIKAWPAKLQMDAQPLLLPLLKVPGDEATFELAPIPVPQGFFDPRIYPYTDSVRLQLERILGR